MGYIFQIKYLVAKVIHEKDEGQHEEELESNQENNINSDQ